MAILGNIRNKAGNTLIALVVFFLIVMCFSGDASGVFSYLFGKSKDQIGTVAGEKVSYSDYHKFYKVARFCNFESQGKRPTREDEIRLKAYVWQKLITQKLYARN